MAKAKTTEQNILAAQRRKDNGRRSTKRLREQGFIPAVLYGRGIEPISISVNRRELSRLLHAKSGEHALIKLRVDGAKPSEHAVLVQDLAHDPVSGYVTHVDFHAIVLTEHVRVKVPIVLKGEPVGVKQDGGILEHFMRELEVECLPTEIPAGVEFDVSALKIGDTLHVRDIPAQKNAKILSEAEGVIASVKMPKVEKVEEVSAAAVSEPEVIKEKKPEGELPSGEAEKAEGSEAKKETKAEK